MSDNASTDSTAACIQKYAPRFENIEIIRRAEMVDFTASFIGPLHEATTEYFVWLADDDWWEPTFLEECVRALDANPAAQTAFTSFRVYYHFLDRYSGVMSYTASTFGDPRLNVFARIGNMAPCAFYGLHRTSAIAQAMRNIAHYFDFKDVAVTVELATYGQMATVDQDLFRAGIRDEAAVTRRSISGGRLRYRPFAKALAASCGRKFGWKSTLVMLPEVFFWVYKLKRFHANTQHAKAYALDPSTLHTRADVEAAFMASVRSGT